MHKKWCDIWFIIGSFVRLPKSWKCLIFSLRVCVCVCVIGIDFGFSICDPRLGMKTSSREGQQNKTAESAKEKQDLHIFYTFPLSPPLSSISFHSWNFYFFVCGMSLRPRYTGVYICEVYTHAKQVLFWHLHYFHVRAIPLFFYTILPLHHLWKVIFFVLFREYFSYFPPPKKTWITFDVFELRFSRRQTCYSYGVYSHL